MLKKMIYFSDGFGGQYENYKNFMNLMKHRDDFARNVEWKFCRGYSKEACSTCKLTTSKKKQILTPRQLYEFASEEIPGITSFYEKESSFSQESVLLGQNYTRYPLIPLFCFNIRCRDATSRMSGEGEPNVIHGNHAVPVR